MGFLEDIIRRQQTQTPGRFTGSAKPRATQRNTDPFRIRGQKVEGLKPVAEKAKRKAKELAKKGAQKAKDVGTQIVSGTEAMEKAQEERRRRQQGATIHGQSVQPLINAFQDEAKRRIAAGEQPAPVAPTKTPFTGVHLQAENALNNLEGGLQPGEVIAAGRAGTFARPGAARDPNIDPTTFGDDTTSGLIKPRSAQEQRQAETNAQRNAAFNSNVVPQGLSDTAGAIGAPGSRFTGSSEDALAMMGLRSVRGATPEARASQQAKALRNRGLFTGTMESREATRQGLEARDVSERRAREAQGLADRQLQAQADEARLGRSEAALQRRSEERISQFESLPEDATSAELGDTVEAQQVWDGMDTNNDGRTSGEERRAAVRRMQDALKAFESLSPEQQKDPKFALDPRVLEAQALKKLLVGEATKKAEGGFFGRKK